MNTLILNGAKRPIAFGTKYAQGKLMANLLKWFNFNPTLGK